MTRIALLFAAAAASVCCADEALHRLQDGLTLLVPNADGKAVTLKLSVRDLNLFESGPREVLVKVYDPAGKAVVREVIPDDGIVDGAYQPASGGWDHEAWYYAYSRSAGAEPMIRWSSLVAPARVKAMAARRFEWKLPAGGKGVWRVMIAGASDHIVGLEFDPASAYAIAGHPDWVVVQGDRFARSFLYVPPGSRGMHLLLAEHDSARARRVTLRDPEGKVIAEIGPAPFARKQVDFDKAGAFDGKVLTLEVSAGSNACLLGAKFRLVPDPEVHHRGERAVSAFLAPDAATAEATRGGAILHDGKVFWQPYQVRFHDYLKTLTPADFETKDAAGKPVAADKLPAHPGFLPVNGPYWRPPLCDRVMHDYQGHRNKQALNVALRDLAAGLRSIGPNDLPTLVVGSPFANMAYEFGNYAWHYWRPSWRVIKHSDAPEPAKGLVREAMLVCGDRLAFCRSWERVNGNAFAQIPAALRYCVEATDDPLQRTVFDAWWERFTTGGWGDRAGVGPSGPVQEGFAYAFHYASYILTTWQAINADLNDPRFRKVHDRIRTWFSYTLASENIAAGPWSSRTHHYPHWQIEPEGPFAWKGLPGPDFAVSVNDGNEFFAARRPTYYALTYHGRLAPKWESHAHPGQAGYGGGMLCQLHVPGRGPVLASTLNGNYGEGMHPSLWADFHIHSVVGTCADGRPLVTGDSEHTGARLNGTVVRSNGDLRDCTLNCERVFDFGADGISCEVRVGPTQDEDLLSLWLKNPLRGRIVEAWEMIPFVHSKAGKGGPVEITLLDAAGKPAGAFDATERPAKTVVIDRGGFGVRIELESALAVKRGKRDTVMILLARNPAAGAKVELKYRLVPFAN